MRTSKGKRYCTDRAALDQYRREIKFVQCPHCHQVGFLIGHGFLIGYAEKGNDLVVRGRRFFCSNRYRRKGCGRTFSVLLSDILLGFMVRVGTLSTFVQGVLSDMSRKAAWENASGGSFSLQSGYRLWQRLQHAQVHIRSFLNRERPPPESSETEPLNQMVEHLRTFFPPPACPFANFQTRFQVSLFG